MWPAANEAILPADEAVVKQRPIIRGWRKEGTTVSKETTMTMLNDASKPFATRAAVCGAVRALQPTTASRSSAKLVSTRCPRLSAGRSGPVAFYAVRALNRTSAGCVLRDHFETPWAGSDK
jgi:hypothetical protein